MSYLQLEKGIPDFSKAVISLWFRVPQASIAAASAQADADPANLPPPLSGIIPLVTFGKRAKRQLFSSRNEIVGSSMYTQDHFASSCEWVVNSGYPYPRDIGRDRYYFTGEEIDTSPSHVGIQCRYGAVQLSVNIQMNDYAAIDGSWPHMAGHSYPAKTDSDPVYIMFDSGGVPHCSNYPATHPDSRPMPLRNWTETTTWESGAAVVMNCQPEVFGTLPIPYESYLGNVAYGQEITPDHWHHLIVSFDLTSSVNTRGIYREVADYPTEALGPGSVASACKMWISFDDKNLTGKTLSGYWAEGSGPNDILTANGYHCYHDEIYRIDARFDDYSGNMVTQLNPGLTTPTCDYTPGLVLASGEHLGIPASAEFVDHILPVEMAEFQMWTGLTLDTSDTVSRRAFIDAEGRPVPPSQKKVPTDPKSFSGSIELLGRKPDILLNSSGNWSIGRNTGVKLERDIETGKITEKPADNLMPIGAIVAYSPDPSLHGLQSPPPRPPVIG